MMVARQGLKLQNLRIVLRFGATGAAAQKDPRRSRVFIVQDLPEVSTRRWRRCQGSDTCVRAGGELGSPSRRIFVGRCLDPSSTSSTTSSSCAGKPLPHPRQCPHAAAARRAHVLTLLALVAGGSAAAAAQHGMPQQRHATPSCARLASAAHHPPHTQLRPHAGTASMVDGQRGQDGRQHRRAAPTPSPPAVRSSRRAGRAGPRRDAGRARLRVLKHDGGRVATCELERVRAWEVRRKPAEGGVPQECRFFGARLSRRHAYQCTQKCLLSAMVCVAQKAFNFCGNVLPPGTLMHTPRMSR